VTEPEFARLRELDAKARAALSVEELNELLKLHRVDFVPAAHEKLWKADYQKQALRAMEAEQALAVERAGLQARIAELQVELSEAKGGAKPGPGLYRCPLCSRWGAMLADTEGWKYPTCADCHSLIEPTLIRFRNEGLEWAAKITDALLTGDFVSNRIRSLKEES